MNRQKIRLLDCTLRDGGFVNNWDFGKDCILSIYKKLDTANIDIIEVGFLDARVEFSEDRTINPDTKSYDNIFSNISKNNAMAVAMVDFGTCPIENISDAQDSFLDGIRVIFKKNSIDDALAYCKQIINKGYKVFVQPVSITSYSNAQWVELIQKINKIQPYSVSIVDTYGLLHKNNLLNYFNLAHALLDDELYIGYHSHNNFQLAYSNSIELVDYNNDRNILVDGSIYGMGKGAGNANLELLAMYLNDNLNKNYNINHILEIIDTHIIKLYNMFGWGYSMQFYLAASNDCHPSYVKFLTERKTLDIKSVNEILKMIENKYKLTFNEDYIEDLYIKYQAKDIKDDEVCKIFIDKFSGRNILVIGPGKSIVEQKEEIDEFIKEKNPIIIFNNHLIKGFKQDYIFVSNKKRYKELKELRNEIDDREIIITSNIRPTDDELIVNYEDLLSQNPLVMDNSMLMIIKCLIKLDTPKVYLAGFDGLSKNKYDNYANESMRYSVDISKIKSKNEAVSQVLKKFKSSIDIKFITKTKYDI